MALESVKKAFRKALSPRGRKRLYKIVSASVAYFAVKGLISGDEVAALLLVVSAVLGVADVHVEVPESPEDAI